MLEYEPDGCAVGPSGPLAATRATNGCSRNSWASIELSSTRSVSVSRVGLRGQRTQSRLRCCPRPSWASSSRSKRRDRRAIKGFAGGLESGASGGQRRAVEVGLPRPILALAGVGGRACAAGTYVAGWVRLLHENGSAINLERGLCVTRGEGAAATAGRASHRVAGEGGIRDVGNRGASGRRGLS